MRKRHYEFKVAIVGLGYVGMPLACLFSKKYDTIGYDINPTKIAMLENVKISEDKTLARALAQGLRLTSNVADLKECNVYIIAVPTPVDENHKPDTSCVRNATVAIANLLKEGDIVIYESTVYPGLTEEVCAPLLEKTSGLKYNHDFFLGFSPERINPGDTVHTIENITKVTSGSTPEVAEIIDSLYNSVLTNGTYKAPNMRVAEACKIMENCQRDVMIAFFNEFQRIFDRMGIDLAEVTRAASTKWNFIPADPGLVGGHCIAVDPYYMIAKAKEAGVMPTLLATAREENETMSKWLADKIKANTELRRMDTTMANVLILGFSFKPDSDDIRNTKVADLYRHLVDMGYPVTIYDPLVDVAKVEREYHIPVTGEQRVLVNNYDVVVVGTRHRIFKNINVKQVLTDNGFVCDIAGVHADL